MTSIQQVHWKLDVDYIGHPYYVSGNAILHALGRQLPHSVHRHLHASHGFFVPGQFGMFPEDHSRNGVCPHLGSGLPPVESYSDLFLFRQPFQEWLLDSRPRDALNTHDIRPQSSRLALANETIIGRPDDFRKRKQTTKWYINAYLHADSDGVLPLDDSRLNGLQFGGKRNYGYGETLLKDTQMVDLTTLDYSHLRQAETFKIVVVTPFVLESEYPGAADQPVPWWWAEKRGCLREREENVVEEREMYRLQTIDHGQMVSYEGRKPIKTAKNGIIRVGTHSKYGFGELRVDPVASSSGKSRHSAGKDPLVESRSTR